jgi:hypothetical protein
MSTITTSSETGNVYDHRGAALYIAVILIWYSTGLAMMLFLQVRPRTLQQQFLFDSSDSSAKKRLQSLSTNPFASYRNIQADNTTKQILNELKDPERRERLWRIYYASSEQQNEPYPKYYQTITSDSATIDRIKRKLADIHRMNLPDGEGPISTSTTINTRPPLVRVQSQTEASSANTSVEMEPLVTGKQSVVPSSNGSRKRNNIFSNRFTIEKVSDNNTILTAVNENISK